MDKIQEINEFRPLKQHKDFIKFMNEFDKAVTPEALLEIFTAKQKECQGKLNNIFSAPCLSADDQLEAKFLLGQHQAYFDIMFGIGKLIENAANRRELCSTPGCSAPREFFSPYCGYHTMPKVKDLPIDKARAVIDRTICFYKFLIRRGIGGETDGGKTFKYQHMIDKLIKYKEELVREGKENER